MTRNEVFDVLKANMAMVLPSVTELRVTEQSSLVRDYGADSLQIVEIVTRTMRGANVRAKRTELTKASNIGELLDLLCHDLR